MSNITRAAELFYDLLKIFNSDDIEYKKLIGDKSLLTYIDEVLSYSTTPYQSGDFSGLTDTINFTGFLPIIGIDGNCNFYVNDYKWIATDTPDVGKTYVGQSLGTTAGSVSFKNGSGWITTARLINDGMITLNLPNSNSVKFYYKKAAWDYAFVGNSSDIVISKDGDVYKGTISVSNLVVNSKGVLGASGGPYQYVVVNDIGTGSISNAVEYTRRIAQFMLLQLNIQTGSENWLTYLGQNIYGIVRLANEPDATYAARIVSEIFSVKCSPLAIQNSISGFADSVRIDDDISTGMFSDSSFSDYYLESNTAVYPDDPGRNVVRGAIAGINGGLPYHFFVYLVNPNLSKAQQLVDTINKFKPSGVGYDIIIV